MTIDLPEGILTVEPLAPNAVRVRVAPRGTPAPPSLVLKAPADPGHVENRETSEAVEIELPELRVHFDRHDGVLRFRDSAGRSLVSETPGGRSLSPSVVQSDATYRARIAFELPPHQRLYGSGQFQDGHLDIRDLPRRLTQVNTQIALPFFLSSGGWALLWHNYGLTDLNPADNMVALAHAGDTGPAATVEVTTASGTQVETRRARQFEGSFIVEHAGWHALMLDVGRTMARRHHVRIDGVTVVDVANYWLPPTTSWRQVLGAGTHTVVVTGEADDQPVLHHRPSQDRLVLRSPVAEALDYVLIAGSPDRAIATYRTLTGPAPLPPLWSLGYIHCRERYKTQDEIVESAREFRRRGIPLDVIVQDWQYWGRHGWNAMRFDEREYPDPAAMTRDLHALHTRLLLSVWSKVDPASVLGTELARRGFYIEGTEWVDFFDPEAARFYWERMSRDLLSLGVDAWWLDATEPENDDLVGRRTRAGAGETVRNVYPLLVTRTVYEGQRRDAPDRRVWILTRSAYPGQQRYGAAVWSGDVGNDWETLRRQVIAGLGVSVSGLPWWTTDTGGFFRPGAGQYRDVGYHERFIRWLQFSVFCPHLRVHGYQTDTEPWRYGQRVEDLTRRYLELRYRLLPYIYSLAARVTSEGYTLMRPLVMDHHDDPVSLDQTDVYQFGPALLVAPVLRGGVTTRSVYLPPGTWVDFWTGETRTGGRTIDCDAPLDRIPLHVRAGSIVPLGSALRHTAGARTGELEVRVYPGADGVFELYEDDGTSYGYERGAFSVIPMTWDNARGELRLGQRRGTYPGMPFERVLNVVLVEPRRGDGDAPCSAPHAVIEYSGQPVQATLPAGQP